MTAQIAAAFGFILPSATFLSLGIILMLSGIKRIDPVFHFSPWIVFFAIFTIEITTVLLVGEKLVGDILSLISGVSVILGILFFLICVIVSKKLLKKKKNSETV